MRNTFTFAGTASSSFGVYISGTGVFNAPERNYDQITIAGRDGAILGLEKNLSNLELTYPAFVYKDLKTQMTTLKSFLMSKIGYQKLTDTYYPDEYRLAYYAGGLEVEPEESLRGGNFDIVFQCKPQRFLTNGDTATSFTRSGTITNPTSFEAKPLLQVYGTGTLTVNGVSITISDSGSSYLMIDCELMEAYLGANLMNSYISLSGNDFPVLKAGSNTITLGSGITQVKITPRWWRL